MRWDCFLGFPGCALAGESWSAGLLRATRLQVVWILPPCFPPAVLTVAWFCFHPADVEWHLPRAGWSWHGCVSPHPGPAGPVPAPARGARQKVLKSQWTCPVLPRTQGRGWLWGALLVQKEVTRPVHLTLAPSLKTPPPADLAQVPQPPASSHHSAHRFTPARLCLKDAELLPPHHLGGCFSLFSECPSVCSSMAPSGLLPRSPLNCRLLKKAFLMTSSKGGTL